MSFLNCLKSKRAGLESLIHLLINVIFVSYNVLYQVKVYLNAIAILITVRSLVFFALRFNIRCDYVNHLKLFGF